MEDRILIIASYEEMGKIYKQRLKELNLDIDVIVVEDECFGVNENDVLMHLEKIVTHEKELIITRGIIAKLIKKNFEIQVVETEVSFIDVLRSMYKYLNYKEPIAVIECDAFTNKVKRLGDLFNLNVKVYNVVEIEKYNILFKEAVDDGMKLIFSGGWLSYYNGIDDIVSSKNVKTVMIKSSEEAVVAALDDALNRYRIIYEEKRKNEILKTVLDFSIGGIISIDKKGKILILNKEAEKHFSEEKKRIIGKNIKVVAPELDFDDVLRMNKIFLGEIHEIDGKRFLINKVPMIVEDEIIGAVATFQEVEDIQKIEHDLRRKLVNKGLTAKYKFDSIRTNSMIMLREVELAKAYSCIDSTVIITGETGTGKEVFAQSIHNASLRKNKPFVAVNCSALSSNLLESELFGYVEGAFTGAKKGGKIGIFELAHKGTIFLDEIGDIEKPIQAKLLRVLQEKEIMRIGDDRVIPIDVRVITATNKDLHREVVDGNFRSDLYYRLNVLNLKLPPLRDRKEDINILVEDLIERINNKLRYKVTSVDKRIIGFFQDYTWPGNIRELQNTIEKIVALTISGQAKYEKVRFFLDDMHGVEGTRAEIDIFNMTLEDIEKYVIQEVLKNEKYNKAKTASQLGISKSTLFRKLDKL